MTSYDFIKFDSVTFSYENNSLPVIDSIDFSIKKGEFVAVIGHNGCGKSTLSKLLNGMFIPTEGRIFIDGIDTSDDEKKYDIRKKVGLVLQNPDNQIVSAIVEEDVAFGPENLNLEPEEIRKRVDNALKIVDMYDRRFDAPYKLSGGQKQRVAIAGVIAMQPDCIVLDEPTSMLDPKGRKEVMTTIKRLNKDEGITVILITHYMDEAVQADRTIVFNKGRIIADDVPRKIFSDIKLLKGNGLDIPQSIQLSECLRHCGYPLPKGILNEEECIISLQQLLEAKNGNHRS